MMRLPPTQSDWKLDGLKLSEWLVERREYMRSVSPSSQLLLWGCFPNYDIEKEQTLADSKQMKQRSGFRDVEAAAACGLGHQSRGNCSEGAQKSEESAVEPLVRDEVSHTPRRGK